MTKYAMVNGKKYRIVPQSKALRGMKSRHPMTGLALQIKRHWLEHRPKMSKQLQDAGSLDQSVAAAAALTREALQQRVLKDGVPYPQAWEELREQWAFLPDEESLPHLGFNPSDLPNQVPEDGAPDLSAPLPPAPDPTTR